MASLRIAIAFAVSLAAGTARAEPCAAPDHVTRVTGGSECLLVKTAGGPGGAAANLFVLLHGNHSNGSPAVSMFRFADKLAKDGPPGTVAVALIRPGYDNAEGEYSSGNAAGRADNFTAANIDIVADAIGRLKAFHRAKRVVLVGHSGGAATTGVILGRHPGLADAAVVVGCPCNVPAWRAARRGMPWSSESAVDYASRVPAMTRVAIIVGSRDDVTPPALSAEFATALRQRGIMAELSVIDDADHVAIIAAPAVFEAALRLADR